MSFNYKSTNIFKWHTSSDLLTITNGTDIATVRGADLMDWIRDQIVTNFCPRCGSFLRSHRMPLNFQCVGCDAFDEQSTTTEKGK